MKATIELTLKTREVYTFFERKLNGNRLFIHAIQHRINSVRNQQPCWGS